MFAQELCRRQRGIRESMHFHGRRNKNATKMSRRRPFPELFSLMWVRHPPKNVWLYRPAPGSQSASACGCSKRRGTKRCFKVERPSHARNSATLREWPTVRLMDDFARTRPSRDKAQVQRNANGRAETQRSFHIDLSGMTNEKRRSGNTRRS